MTDKNTVDTQWLAAQLLTATWHTSSRSSGGTNCVQVAFLPHGLVALRDSKNPHHDPHLFTDTEYDAFVNGILLGELRRPAD